MIIIKLKKIFYIFVILGIKCKEDYIGHEYDYNKIEENILYIRNSWNKIMD